MFNSNCFIESVTRYDDLDLKSVIFLDASDIPTTVTTEPTTTEEPTTTDENAEPEVKPQEPDEPSRYQNTDLAYRRLG